jgi:ankyrin repeat protein
MWASQQGHGSAVQTLLEAGADRTVRDKVIDSLAFIVRVVATSSADPFTV